MATFDFSKKAVLWDLDETLYSRRDAARRMFPGMFRACLYEGRSDDFINEAVSYQLSLRGTLLCHIFPENAIHLFAACLCGKD